MSSRRTTYEKLCQRLGQLDKERRTIINQLKSTPELSIKYLRNQLDAFVKRGQWFSRKNAKDEFSYFKLIKFKFDEKGITQSETKKRTMLHVALEWEYYDYNTPTKAKAIEQVVISVFNDIETQVLNGRVAATGFDEKSLLKEQLTLRKKQLEEELKSIKGEIALIK